MLKVRAGVGRGLIHAERALAEAHESISHGDFGGQRLQGVQPIIGILCARLQLLVIMLQSVLLAPQRIVISDFPEHPGIRAGSGKNGDSANNRKNSKKMQHIDGYDDLPECTLPCGCDE